MSNRITIQRTVFKNFNTENETYGYRIYDDYGQSYSNIMDLDELKLNDNDFIHAAHDMFDDISNAMFEFALEQGHITIDDTYYNINLNGDEGWELVEPA